VTGRLVIAGTHSGAGKTTVASGLMAALSRAGRRVAPFKVGPDFIDPSYHRLACGRPGRNLDAFLSGPELIAPLVRHGAAGADLVVVEGVMGLFDGASGGGELASTAHVAKLLDAPVVLVIDASAMARSVAAIVHGFTTFDPDLRLGGVILNRVGSPRHEAVLRQGCEQAGVPVFGAIPRADASTTSTTGARSSLATCAVEASSPRPDAPSNSPITPSTTATSAPAPPWRASGAISSGPERNASRFRPGRPAASAW